MPAGPDAANATLLPLNTVDSFDIGSSGDGEVFFYMTPSTTGSYHFQINHVTGTFGGYVDVYRLTEANLAAFAYTTWVGWCGDHFSSFAAYEESWVEMIGGQTYVIPCYNIEFTVNGTYTLEVDGPGGPSNDRVVNATLITPALSGQWIAGTTVGASEEEYEFNNFLGNQQGSVWYKVVQEGPSVFSYGVRSLTPGWHPRIDVYHGPGAEGAGTVNSTADLDPDISGVDVGNGTENPPPKTYDVDGTPGSTAGDLAPLEGGETFYLAVTGWENLNASYKGAFEIFATVAPAATCFDCVDYINGSSSTASVVSGSVRETQQMDQTLVDPFEGRGDTTATLIIPGDDILDGSPAGLYAVSVKSKNNTSGFFIGMFKRNGQPLHPGGIFDSTTGSTPVTDWMTAPAGAQLDGFDKPISLNMVWYLPVGPGDEIEFSVHSQTTGSRTIDLTQICFQRIWNAIAMPAYDNLDIPDYPLGTSASDVADGNAEQAGDLCIYKGTAPTYHIHDVDGHDFCVTSDGVIWVLTELEASTTSGTRWIGPYLCKWDPSSPGWTIVNDDIEGLGVKRSTRGGVSAFDPGPYRVSIDTDGEDIWVAYGVDDGAFVGGGRNTKVKVRKYDVSADTWTTIGSPFCGPDHGGTTIADGALQQAAADFNDCAVIRVSPNGKPWVSFTDQSRLPGSPPESTFYYFMKPYVAEWTGSTWEIHELVAPNYFPPDIDTYEAETYIGSSGTASVVTEDGQSCVRETQTSAAADSIVITPPAGKYMVRLRVQYNRASGTGGIAAKLYKNGTQWDGQANNMNASSATNPTWFETGQFLSSGVYQTFNGTTDTLEIRFWRTGTADEVFVDKVYLHEAGAYIQQFDFNARYVDDGQPQVALWMRQPGEAAGLSENPSAFVVWDINHPELTDTDSIYYIPPGQPIIDYATTDFRNAYYEWNGSGFDLIWDKLTEEDIPDHVFVVTREDSIASTPPYGHFQQGMGFCSGPFGSETDNYIALNTGGGQAFGFFGDTIIATKVTAEGLEAFTTGPPSILQGAGYPAGFTLGLAGFSGWAWDIGARAIHCDSQGRVWLHWAGSGPEFDSYMFFALAYPYNNGDNGLGGWFAAADMNEQMGFDPIEDASGRIMSSPDGSKIYFLQDPLLFNWTAAEPGTYGVWECDDVIDAHIPLVKLISGAIDLARVKLRAFFLGDA